MTETETKKSLSFEDFRAEVLNDYKLAVVSRECSLLGRREVLTGKAKFGIFGDGKEVPQLAMAKAFKNGDFTTDTIIVVRFQGPQANGMPELHGLTPMLSVLQDKGLKIALVTDGRMSGASGKVPAAIHISPEAVVGGPLAKLQDGDIVRVDAINGRIDVLSVGFDTRKPTKVDLSENGFGLGRELFHLFRQNAASASEGAGVFRFI